MVLAVAREGIKTLACEVVQATENAVEILLANFEISKSLALYSFYHKIQLLYEYFFDFYFVAI